jgi:membrane protease YdiL (CAAX protease family)
VEENEQNKVRPVFTFGPGMRLWLLVALNFACVGLFQMMSSSSSLAWMNAGPEDGYPVSYARIAIALTGILFFAVPAIVYANVFPPDRFAFFRTSVRVSPLILLLAGISMVLILPGFDMMYEVIHRSISDPGLKAMQDVGERSAMWVENMPSTGDLFACILVSALVPAVCEELFFRACIQQVVREWTKKPYLSILISSTFFALIHFNPAGFFVILAAGLMLGYAFERTGSIRTSMLMHFCFNTTSILESFGQQHSGALANWEQPLWIGLLSLVIGCGVYSVFVLRSAKRPDVS